MAQAPAPPQSAHSDSAPRRDRYPLALIDDHVAFTWKDYRQGGVTKTIAPRPDEFIRRFLHHTLPDGFYHIRHFGFMANRHCSAKLALCRALLGNQRTTQPIDQALIRVPDMTSTPPVSPLWCSRWEFCSRFALVSCGF